MIATLVEVEAVEDSEIAPPGGPTKNTKRATMRLLPHADQTRSQTLGVLLLLHVLTLHLRQLLRQSNLPLPLHP